MLRETPHGARIMKGSLGGKVLGEGDKARSWAIPEGQAIGSKHWREASGVKLREAKL
jgi:hypothetical protein